MKTSKHKPKAKPKCKGVRGVARAAAERAVQEGQDPELAKHAAVIRKLSKRAITDIIEVGRQLKLAKGRVGHGNWEPWLKKEFGWSAATALNFIHVYELAEDYKSVKFTDLRIAPSALYALARPSTPDEVRDEMMERAEAGKPISNNDVQEAIQATPAETEQPAQEGSEEQAEEQVSPDTWNGRRMLVANKAAGDARIEDWTKFALKEGVFQAVKNTADAWRRLVEHFEQQSAKAA